MDVRPLRRTHAPTPGKPAPPSGRLIHGKPQPGRLSSLAIIGRRSPASSSFVLARALTGAPAAGASSLTPDRATAQTSSDEENPEQQSPQPGGPKSAGHQIRPPRPLTARTPWVRQYGVMADRYRTASGWSVEVVERSATPDNSDGQQLRVRYHGFYVADVRTVAELEQYFPLADLEPDGLSSAATRRPAGGRLAHDRRHHQGAVLQSPRHRARITRESRLPPNSRERCASWWATVTPPERPGSNDRSRQHRKRRGTSSPTSLAWVIGLRRRPALNGPKDPLGQQSVPASRAPTR